MCDAKSCSTFLRHSRMGHQVSRPASRTALLVPSTGDPQYCGICKPRRITHEEVHCHSVCQFHVPRYKYRHGRSTRANRRRKKLWALCHVRGRDNGCRSHSRGVVWRRQSSVYASRGPECPMGSVTATVHPLRAPCITLRTNHPRSSFDRARSVLTNTSTVGKRDSVMLVLPRRLAAAESLASWQKLAV